MKRLFKFTFSTGRTRQLIGLSLLAMGLTMLFSVPSLSDRARKHDAFAGTTSRTTNALASSVQPFDNDLDAAKRTHVAATYGKLPMMFQANAGQTDERVKFMARGAGYSLFLTPTESVFVMSRRGHDSEIARSESQAVLRMKLVGGNARAAVTGVEEMAGKVNYFIGNDPNNWRANVPTYGRVHYSEVYPGVDLIYYGNQRQLEYDFVVAPGADWRQIALAFGGAKEVEVEEASGDLLLHTSLGVLRQHRPQIYQEVNGTRRMISGRYVKQLGREIGFEIAHYDTTKPLVIDPSLVYSTYLGGSGAGKGSNIGGDGGSAIAVDTAGNAYITGFTNSPDFPTTADAYQATYPGSSCTFVTKLNPSGTALVYSTYLGEGDATAIAVDASGNAYIAGVTGSPSFPTTPGAFQTAYGGFGSNAFITKLNPSGTALVYSTYLGGTGNPGFQGITGGDAATGIAVDSSGNACVTGTTYSHDFPTTPGAFQTTNNANNAINPKTLFVTKLNSGGSGLIYSTYLGGTELEQGGGIAVDVSSNAYVTGSTGSADFPVTPGAFRTTYPGFRSAIAAKFNADGTALVYSTFLGGSAFGGTDGRAIAVDASGNAYLAGRTQSSNYPTTFGSFRKGYCGGFSDAFVTKLNADGTALVYSTYLCGVDLNGGDDADDAFGIAVDATGNAYIAGYTDSDFFPTTPDAYQTKRAGFDDVFLTKLKPDGSDLVYSTYLGGSKFDDGYAGIAVDDSGHAYVAGATESTDFPTTPGAFQTTYHDGNDVFVAKFDFSATAPADQLLNIATRLPVQTGDNILIGGFIITGTEAKKVLILGIGPSLAQFFSGSLSDPTLELFQGDTLLQTNDDWKESQAEVQATGLQPSNDFESAIVRTLDPGSYTGDFAGQRRRHGDRSGAGI